MGVPVDPLETHLELLVDLVQLLRKHRLLHRKQGVDDPVVGANDELELQDVRPEDLRLLIQGQGLLGNNERVRAIELVQLLHVGHLTQQPDQLGVKVDGQHLGAVVPAQQVLLQLIRGHRPHLRRPLLILLSYVVLQQLHQRISQHHRLLGLLGGKGGLAEPREAAHGPGNALHQPAAPYEGTGGWRHACIHCGVLLELEVDVLDVLQVRGVRGDQLALLLQPLLLDDTPVQDALEGVDHLEDRVDDDAVLESGGEDGAHPPVQLEDDSPELDPVLLEGRVIDVEHVVLHDAELVVGLVERLVDVHNVRAELLALGPANLHALQAGHEDEGFHQVQNVVAALEEQVEPLEEGRVPEPPRVVALLGHLGFVVEVAILEVRADPQGARQTPHRLGGLHLQQVLHAHVGLGAQDQVIADLPQQNHQARGGVEVLAVGPHVVDQVEELAEDALVGELVELHLVAGIHADALEPLPQRRQEPGDFLGHHGLVLHLADHLAKRWVVGGVQRLEDGHVLQYDAAVDLVLQVIEVGGSVVPKCQLKQGSRVASGIEFLFGVLDQDGLDLLDPAHNCRLQNVYQILGLCILIHLG
mmetsp:Transcript_120631/g.210023  ORF Transcript_120631/g.210023 Transcript_120631/m.210023 type:complete len:586 (+) Transcript_120631:9970-11727(+)